MHTSYIAIPPNLYRFGGHKQKSTGGLCRAELLNIEQFCFCAHVHKRPLRVYLISVMGAYANIAQRAIL